MNIQNKSKHNTFMEYSKKLLSCLLIVSMIIISIFGYSPKESTKSYAAAGGTTRVSVHDPSIFKDPASDRFYIYGSHLAQAYTTDFRNWTYLGTQGYDNTTVYGNNSSDRLESALASSFAWAGYNDQDSTGGYAVWAPDIIYNPSYNWSDGSKGAYMMYYCTSSTYIRSCIGYAVSKSVTGPFQYVDTIVYSGFTLNDNNITSSSNLGSKTVNTKYTNTNISTLINNGTLSGVRSGWFHSDGSFNNTLFPNAIDPNLLFDASGRMWMSYGSWSGGIFLLELNPATGNVIYPGSNSGNTDAYFGTRIAGGYTKSGEAPYIIYDAEAGYYYMYVTYGWLGVDGGYHMRLYRSANITGPYTDAAGNSAVFTSTTVQAERGVKIFGNYKFSGLDTGYKSGGHNSAIIHNGERRLVYHTRFNTGNEFHEVRVHQQFLNQDKWPVTAVYEDLGSVISQTGYSMSDMKGTYEFVNHGLDASTGNVGMLSTLSVSLNSDGTITGNVTGTWSYTSGTYYASMVIGGITYKGVFFKQYDETSKHNNVMTFSLIGPDNRAIWGSKVSNDEYAAIKLDGTYYIQNMHSKLYLDVENGLATDGANIRQWDFNGSEAQKFKLVSNGNGYYHILTGASAYKSGLDVDSGSPDDGANIMQWEYWGGNMQQFKLSPLSDGTYAILTKASGDKSSLDVYEWSTVAGGNVCQWVYWGATLQHWRLIPA